MQTPRRNMMSRIHQRLVSRSMKASDDADEGHADQATEDQATWPDPVVEAADELARDHHAERLGERREAGLAARSARRSSCRNSGSRKSTPAKPP